MLMAFVLGFWCLWMGEREPSVLLEGLFFAIIAIVGNGFMQWKVPDPDTVWALQWGLVWVWAAVPCAFASVMLLRYRLRSPGARCSGVMESKTPKKKYLSHKRNFVYILGIFDSSE